MFCTPITLKTFSSRDFLEHDVLSRVKHTAKAFIFYSTTGSPTTMFLQKGIIVTNVDTNFKKQILNNTPDFSKRTLTCLTFCCFFYLKKFTFLSVTLFRKFKILGKYLFKIFFSSCFQKHFYRECMQAGQ